VERNKRRMLTRIGAVALILGLIPLTSLYALGVLARWQTSRMISDLSPLRVGDPLARAVPVLQRYNAERAEVPHGSMPIGDVCQDQADETYSIRMSPVSPQFPRRFGLLYWLPLLHYWSFGATIYARGDRVVCVSESLGLVRPYPTLSRIHGERSLIAEVDLSPSPRYSNSRQENYVIGTRTIKGVTTGQAYLLPGASNEEFKNAFNVNLGCLTSFLQCKDACDLMPATCPHLQGSTQKNSISVARELNE
jgi:hypothetical protein